MSSPLAARVKDHVVKRPQSLHEVIHARRIKFCGMIIPGLHRTLKSPSQYTPNKKTSSLLLGRFFVSRTRMLVRFGSGLGTNSSPYPLLQKKLGGSFRHSLIPCYHLISNDRARAGKHSLAIKRAGNSWASELERLSRWYKFTSGAKYPFSYLFPGRAV